VSRSKRIPSGSMVVLRENETVTLNLGTCGASFLSGSAG
jgi:hypothetical protein